MQNDSALFLDNSTQIARHWDLPKARERITQDISGRRLYCSVYVQRQYKATLLNALIVLHNLVKQSVDPLEALHRSNRREELRKAMGKATAGEGSLVRDAGHRLLRMYPDRYPTKEEVLDRLARLIEDDWEELFLEGIESPLCDQTGCMRAARAPRRHYLGYFFPVDHTCNLTAPRDCEIRRFWQEHGLDLVALTEAVIGKLDPGSKPRKTMEKIQEHAERILANQSPQGQRCSVFLSDAIIAIESRHAPEPAVLHTTDGDFEPICECLNVPFRVFRSDSSGVVGQSDDDQRGLSSVKN